MRKIALSAETMEFLKQEHEKHPGNPYLFPSPVTGGMCHPDSVVKLHQKILKDAGLEHIRFHDLRHTFAPCCGARQKLRLSKQARFLPTAATRSPRFFRPGGARFAPPCLAGRDRCQDRIQYAGPQQRRIHPCHLHPRHEQGAGTGGGKNGKSAETGALSSEKPPLCKA